MMNNIHFHKISIKGFRGRNFDLNMNPRGEHSVFIMDGNTGKTTTIELLRWCFKFKETEAEGKFEHMWEIPAHIFDDTKKGQQVCTIEVLFSAFDNDKVEHFFKFNRTAKGKHDPNSRPTGDRIESIQDFLEVDNGKEVYKNDSAFEYLNSNFRFKDCHEYFCFDGEKAREIMQITGNPEKISRLMESIESRTKHLPLQIIKSHLETLKNEIYALAKTRSTDKALQKYILAYERENNEIKNIKAECERIRINLKSYEKAINDLIEQKKILQRKIVDEKSKKLKIKVECEMEQKEIISNINNKRLSIYNNYKNLLWYENLDGINKIKSKLKEKGRLPEPYRKNLIEDCLREGKCQICNRPLDEKAIETIKNLERQIAPHSVQTFLENTFSMSNNNLDPYTIKKEIDQMIDDYDKLKIKIESLTLTDDEIRTVTEMDEINKIIEEFNNRITNWKTDIKDLKQLLKEKQNQVKDLERKIDILRDNKNILDAIDNSLDILKTTEDQIKDTATKIIGQAISEGVSSILGPRFSAKLSDDGLLLGEDGSYTTGKGGYSGRLILAYCFAEAMTLIDPIIIDTPVGNIGSHRELLAKHLMKNHNQIILLCLPTEMEKFGSIISQNPIEIKNMEV